MNRLLNKHLVGLKYRVFNKSLLDQISFSQKNLDLDKDCLRKLQWKKFKELLVYAYYNCSFYYEKYNRCGVRLSDINDFDDMAKLPLLTKNEIRVNLDRIVPTGINRMVLEEVRTGGTTGIPLKIYRDRRKSNVMMALYVRTLRLWGLDLGAKSAWFWGLSPEQDTTYDFDHQSKARFYLKNTTWFNTFNMTEKRMVRFARILNAFCPSLIVGYVSALYEYAKFLLGNNIEISSPRAVWITAEPSDSTQRETIEEAFGTKTYSQYGSSEILHIGVECKERNGLHIHADSRYVEIVDPRGVPKLPGDYGHIVVTDLENTAMPLIRYMNDDMGRWCTEACECGLCFPRIRAVVGRTYDLIRLRSGKIIYGHLFSRILFNYIKEIGQFQVHQTAIDRIDIRIVPGNICDFKRFGSMLIKEFKKYTNNEVTYSLKLVSDIKRETSGKVRYVKSDIKEPHETAI